MSKVTSLAESTEAVLLAWLHTEGHKVSNAECFSEQWYRQNLDPDLVETMDQLVEDSQQADPLSTYSWSDDGDLLAAMYLLLGRKIATLMQIDEHDREVEAATNRLWNKFSTDG